MEMNLHLVRHIKLTAFTVQYEDLRAPKPRARYEEPVVMDQQMLDALQDFGIPVPEYLSDKYLRRGFVVLNVKKDMPRRTATVDINWLWNECTEAPQENNGVAADLIEAESKEVQIHG